MSSVRSHSFGKHAILAAAVLLSSGCHENAVVRVAHHGTLKELSTSIERLRQAGPVAKGTLHEIAVAVVERELAASRDEDLHVAATAVPIEQLGPCARTLGRILSRRGTLGDDSAGAAQFSRVDAGTMLSDAEWSNLANSPHGWARAAAALASREPSRFYFRQQSLTDEDARVRRAALLSCIEAPAEEHRSTLVQLLRAAPDAGSRALAARALGVLGGDAAYESLVDAWPGADTDLRLSIVNAMAQKRSFDAGGGERLVAFARSEPGLVGIAAAVSLTKGTAPSREAGVARLTRALNQGSTEELRLAISAAEWRNDEHARALLRWGLRGEPLVQITALSRWLERPEYVFGAQLTLRQLSEGATTSAVLARHVLAEHGDRSIVHALRAQLGYAAADVRSMAAADLHRLEDWSSVSRALADDAPRVRLRTACLVLEDAPIDGS
ncbi:MAG: hypothetical protein QM784_26910 [Polyangiaceae bacterium]